MSTKSISKNALFKSILNLCNIILPIIVMPAVTNVLSPIDISYMTQGETFNTVLLAFASFGIYQYGLREISKVREDKKKLSQTFTSLFLITSITTAIICIVYMIFLFKFYRNNPAFYTCVILGLNIVFNLFYVEWVNEALENYDFITMKTMILKITYSIIVLLLIKSSDKFLLYIYLGIGVNIANNIISFIYVNRKIRFDFSNLQFKNHIKPMFSVVILSNTSLLYTQLDKLMVSRYSSPLDLSSYGIAQKAMFIINTLMLTIIQVTMPRLSNDLGNNNKEKYFELLSKVVKIYFLLLFPASIGLFCVSKQVMWIFERQSWTYVPFTPLMMAFAIYMLTIGIQGIISNQIIYLHGKERKDVKLIFIGGIANVIFNCLLLISGNLNSTNTVITTMIANIIVIILEYRMVKKDINIDIKLFSINNMKYFIYSLPFIPITFVINKFIPSMITSCILDVSVCSVLYLGILLITKDKVLNEVYLRIIKTRLNNNK